MHIVRHLLELYIVGFKNMRLGRMLWCIVIVKLVILFGVIRVWFMPDMLEKEYANDAQRAAHVLETLTRGRQ